MSHSLDIEMATSLIDGPPSSAAAFARLLEWGASLSVDLTAAVGRAQLLSAGDVSAVVGRLGLVRPGRRPVGLDAGRFVVPDDFDADLPEDVLAGFGGEDPR